jgi:hypothetical protein
MTLSYTLFGVPRTLEEFIKKSASEGRSILISYGTEEEVVSQPESHSSFLSFKIYQVLYSAPAPGTARTEKYKQFKLEIDRGTKSQFTEDNPVFYETVDAVRRELPEVVELCKKYGVKFKLDEKTADIARSDPALMRSIFEVRKKISSRINPAKIQEWSSLSNSNISFAEILNMEKTEEKEYVRIPGEWLSMLSEIQLRNIGRKYLKETGADGQAGKS